MLTAKQRELLHFITVRLEDSGISPSFEEMKEALDLKSKSGVHRLISALEERGFIRRLPNRARALEVIRQAEDSVAAPRAKSLESTHDNVVPLRRPAPVQRQIANDVVELPLHGRIAAGVPIEALEGQSTLPVPAALLGPGEHYALEVSGDSMARAGAPPGATTTASSPLILRSSGRLTWHATEKSWWRWCGTRKRPSSTCTVRTAWCG